MTIAGTVPQPTWAFHHPKIVIGIAAVLWGQAVALRLPWRALPWVAWATACAWAFSLAMIDGWQRGIAGRLTARHEYLRQVPTVTDIPDAVRTFASRILDFQPNSWITHVSGHPPGALLTFVWLDRVGNVGDGRHLTQVLVTGGEPASEAALPAVDHGQRERPCTCGGPGDPWQCPPRQAKRDRLPPPHSGDADDDRRDAAPADVSVPPPEDRRRVGEAVEACR